MSSVEAAQSFKKRSGVAVAQELNSKITAGGASCEMSATSRLLSNKLCLSRTAHRTVEFAQTAVPYRNPRLCPDSQCRSDSRWPLACTRDKYRTAYRTGDTSCLLRLCHPDHSPLQSPSG